MASVSLDRSTRDRIILILIGALAGLAAWALVDILPQQIENERAILFIATATGGFFAAFLAATGPLPFPRAALAAAVSALPAAGLLTWASLRFATVDGFLETLHPVVAYTAIVVISLPFLIAAQRPGEGWRNYPALFSQSWNIVVRYAAAWLFVGVFWGVLYLSDTLFGLVGLTVIQDLMDIEVVPYLLTGAVLGLALAVVVELSDYVSPFLILRLLRLLVPVVLVVIAVFLVALPMRGLSNLFGDLSAAATLLAMAIGVATLITSALDRTDDEAVEAGILRVSVQLLALGLPLLAALAIYSVWLRVAEYGWTPNRLAAMTAAAIVAGYAVLYALPVIARRNWPARIRSANTGMALVSVFVSAVWLTPIMNPQRIAAQDQVARFVVGKTDIKHLDLWFLGRELGFAGDAALDRLSALDSQPEALVAALARLHAAQSQYDFEQSIPEPERSGLIMEIETALVLRPDGAALPPGAFDRASVSDLSNWANGCARRTPKGRAGCVLVLADFLAARPGDEAMMLWMPGPNDAAIRMIELGREPAAPAGGLVFLSGDLFVDITPATVDALHEGDFGLAPASALALNIGPAQIVVQP